MRKDIISAGVILCACVFFYILTYRINVVAGFENMAPSMWPRFNIIGMAILSCWIVLRCALAKGRRETPGAGTTPGSPFPLGAVAGSVGILFGFVFLTPYLGFLLTAFAATAAFMHLLGEKKKRVVFLISFVLVALIYIVFGKIMFVPMPRGMWVFQEISYFLY